jgi:hypothetical protein
MTMLLKQAQSRYGTLFWRRVNPVLSAMKRPPTLTILMWFCAIYAIGAVFGIAAVIVDLGRYLGGYSFKRKRSEIFTVVFYGLRIFSSKAMRSRVTRCKL